MPGHRVEAVANAFLRRAMAEGATLTNMTLQKLPYIAQGWALALLDRALVADTPVSYPYGPVYPTLYAALREYGAGAVRRLIRQGDGMPGAFFSRDRRPVIDAVFDADEARLIDAVWESYKGFSVPQLTALLRRQAGPMAVARVPAGARRPIPNAAIKAHYAALLDARRGAA